ncbi:GNAT family N-acetyltransferase [Leptolyngbya sp. 15MV]|nr:GNAT family N-acetyltransferase [Leptolyngbya sp. 15MV]
MDRAILRPAIKADSEAIAKLFLISSDGLAAYIWSRLAEAGEDLATVGARRYAPEGVAFSYENCVIAECEGEVAGMLHAFPMEDDPGTAPEPDPVLRPYSELEDYGSLYVSGVALFPNHRGRGIGTQLMAEAAERAKELGLPRVSLICFEQNAAAMRLYGRLGYAEIDRRPIVPHPTLHYADGDAVLLARNVAP